MSELMEHRAMTPYTKPMIVFTRSAGKPWSSVNGWWHVLYWNKSWIAPDYHVCNTWAEAIAWTRARWQAIRPLKEIICH